MCRYTSASLKTQLASFVVCPKVAPYRSAFRNRFGRRTSHSSWTGLEYRGRLITRRRRERTFVAGCSGSNAGALSKPTSVSRAYKTAAPGCGVKPVHEPREEIRFLAV